MRAFEIALGECADHVVEWSKPHQDNPKIIAYHAATSLGAKVDEIAWCSAFVCWCLEQAGIRSTRSAMARSYLTWDGGLALEKPVVGAIVVLARGLPGSNQGHVGFVAAIRPGAIAVLAGNQGNAVSLQWFPIDRVLAYRWPASMPLPLAA